MKTVLLNEYKFGKAIADNLETLLSNKYTEISDEEYTRVKEAIDEYLSGSNNAKSFATSISSKEIIDLRNMISALKPLSYEVEEDGLYFVDEEGNIGAKIISTGLYAINLTNNETPQVGALKDLTDVDIVSPSTGQSLIYNSTANKWKNTTVDGTISGDFTIIDY